MSHPRVVVAGGGFGGLACARRLCRSGHATVRLVDRNNYFIFKPLLSEVATGMVDPTDAVVSLREYVPGTHPARAEVVGLDRDAQCLQIRYGGAPDETASLEYDVLVLALGSETDFFGIEGLAESALTLNTVGDALTLRHRILNCLERAELEHDTGRRAALQTFVVGGGSFTGVEVAGALTDYLKRALPNYPRLDLNDIRVVLIEMKDRLLPNLPGKTGEIAADELISRGVDVRLGVAFESLRSDGTTQELAVSDGQRIRTNTVLWAGGVQPNALLADLPVSTDSDGRVVVNERLRVNGSNNIYALGDGAAIPDGRGGTYPATAQHADREGHYLATALDSIFRSKNLRPNDVPRFHYDGAGMLVSLGERRATGEVFGRTVSGLSAWALWRAYYLGRLPTMSRKLRVATDWLFTAASGPTLVELPTR